MNQTIIDNRNKINTACQLCFYAVESYREDLATFYEKRSQIMDSPVYSPGEKDRQIGEAQEEMRGIAQTHYQKVKTNLDTMRVVANEMDNLLDVGANLQNALSVIQVLGSDLPEETQRKIVVEFKGQYQALIILKQAFEKVNIETPPIFDEVLFENGSAAEINKLNKMASNLINELNANFKDFVALGYAVEKFADALGVQLTKRFKDIVDLAAIPGVDTNAMTYSEMCAWRAVNTGAEI